MDEPKILNLKNIEKRLLEIDEEKSRRTHNLKENYSNSIDDEIEFQEIKYLDVEKEKLQMMRQFILDKRENWKFKIIWDICAPIIVSLFVWYLTKK